MCKKYLFGEKDNKNKSISSILKSIFTEDHSYNKCNKYEKQKILEAIRFILLPLQYLVKHIAFQEEQECRIMYITQFRDKKIHSDREKQWMYVEYEEPVLPHIDEVYLSPARRSTKTTSASCLIETARRARFVSLKTHLETRSKGARSLHESSSST